VFDEAGFDKVGIDERENVRLGLRIWDSIGDFYPPP